MSLQHRRRQTFSVAIAIFVTVCSFITGCSGEKEANTTAAPASGQAAPAGTGNTAVKPTAEQEAARKRGEAMGPAIQAANEAAQKGASAPTGSQ